jgi:putative ABC transport system ATP-binding protein
MFGQTIVMVTHEPKVSAVTDRILLLADGRIIDELRRPSAAALVAAVERVSSP